MSELEGILQLLFFTSKQSAAKKDKEIQQHIIQLGKNAFNSPSSLGFTDLFEQYLNKVIFYGYSLGKGKIPLTRHSVNHGVADESDYSQKRALQLILALDQVFYFAAHTDQS